MNLPKAMNLKPIKTNFRLNEFDFSQIHRQGNLAIYEQTKIGRATEAIVRAFEVVVIQVSARGPWTEPQFSHVEWYPKSDRWGELGWTFQTRDEAFRKLSELSDQILKSIP